MTTPGGGETERLIVRAKLKPGAKAEAIKLVRSGPPFDLLGAGLERHGVYIRDDEVAFYFEGPSAERRLRSLINDPALATGFVVWAPLTQGPPSLLREEFYWEREERTMDRILVATDGSRSARDAVAFAVELGRAEGAQLSFVHVLPPTERELLAAYAPPVIVPRPPPVAPKDADAAEPLQEARAVAEEAGVPAKLELRAGYYDEEIVRLADTIDADLIVVGSRGLGALKGALLGSVSRGVLRRAKRPVLVVRPPQLREEVPE